MAAMTTANEKAPEPQGGAETRRPSRILIDCTETFASGLTTGIQRVVREIAGRAEQLSRDTGIPCIPIITDGVKVRQVPFDALASRNGSVARPRGRVVIDRGRAIWDRWVEPLLGGLSLRVAARRFAWLLLIMAPMRLKRRTESPEIPLQKGDLLLLPDSFWGLGYSVRLAGKARANGVCVVPVIHDIFPITHPELSDSKNAAVFKTAFGQLLPASDALLAVSRFTQSQVEALLKRQGLPVPPIMSFRLGADPFPLGPEAAPFEADLFPLQNIYLMVGTIEPRKGHAVVLDAFERLWHEGSQATLVFIGRVGWRCEGLRNRLESHPLRGRRLFVFYDATDAELHHAYTHAKALIIASRVEGFGLPLVEAMRYGVPVIASDIEVFREIGGDYPEYFAVDDVDELHQLLDQNERREIGARSPRDWPGWDEAARDALQAAIMLYSDRVVQDMTSVLPPNC